MAKADREPVVMYSAFCPSAGENATTGTRRWGAIDIAAAARLQLAWLWKGGWRPEPQHQDSQPVPVYVLDPSVDKIYEVLVEIRWEPVFVASEPTETGK